MSLSNTFETRTLEWLLTTGAVTRPTAWFVGLYTTNPGETNTGTEVAAAGYARQSATFAVAGNIADNANVIEFPVAGASWGTITHAAVFDAVTAGNMIAYGPLLDAKTIAAGDVLRIPIGDFAVSAD